MGCRIQSIYGTTDGGVPVMVTVDDPEAQLVTIEALPMNADGKVDKLALRTFAMTQVGDAEGPVQRA